MNIGVEAVRWREAAILYFSGGARSDGAKRAKTSRRRQLPRQTTGGHLAHSLLRHATVPTRRLLRDGTLWFSRLRTVARSATPVLCVRNCVVDFRFVSSL